MSDIKLNKKQRSALDAVVTATNNNVQHFLPAQMATALAGLKLIMIHATEKDAKGNPLVAATDLGKETSAIPAVAVERSAPSVPDGGFEIVTGVTLPTKAGRGRREAVYPFDKLAEIGHGFFIPATEAKPEPWRTMNSTVNSANKRYKDAQPQRVFGVSEWTKEDGTKGAMIARIAPPAPTPPAPQPGFPTATA